MNPIDVREVIEFVEERIPTFHVRRTAALRKTTLSELLTKKNPYLFRAKYVVRAQDLVESLLEAKLSSSEEEIFGEFLEGLAVFVAKKTLNATESSAAGIDFEFQESHTRFLVAVKSGVNWGNNDQWKALKANFESAAKVLRARPTIGSVERTKDGAPTDWAIRHSHGEPSMRACCITCQPWEMTD